MRVLFFLCVMILSCGSQPEKPTGHYEQPEPPRPKDIRVRIVEAFNQMDLLVVSASTPEQFKSYGGRYDEWSGIIKESKGYTDNAILDSVAKLKRKLISLQKKQLPQLRKSYADLLKRLLWREDISVKTSGNGYSLLHFSGGHYALNANIQDTYKSIYDVVRALRFKKVLFKWSDYSDEYQYYTVDTKGDSDL